MKKKHAHGKLRAVIDTNVIVSGFASINGIPNQILRAWQKDHFTLLTSVKLISELIDVLSRSRIKKIFKIEQREIQDILTRLLETPEYIAPVEDENLLIHSRDHKDDKLLACAIGGKAEYLVTGDRDLLVLNGNAKIGNLKIVSPKEFLEIIS